MNKRKKNCPYCFIPTIRYKCIPCNCTGKIEIPKDIKWHSGKAGDFTVISTDFIICDQCKGKGWILVPPIIADKYPENVMY